MFGAATDLITWALWALFLVVKAWAFIDCVRRPAQAFPAVNRVSKPLWLILTAAGGLTALLPSQTLGIFGIAGLVVALVYLFDVRTRIIGITGGGR